MDSDALIAAFRALVLEHTPDGRFLCRSSVPEWCQRCSHIRPGDWVAIEEAFPFLSVFLPDAEAGWRAHKSCTSPLWTETGAHGEDVHLEAEATYVGETPILAIWQNERVYRQLALAWGVVPVRSEFVENTDDLLAAGEERLKARGFVEKGDTILMLSGHSPAAAATNMLRVHTVS